MTRAVIENRAERREAQRYLKAENAKYPAHMVEVSFARAGGNPPPGLVTAWRSRDYLVQVFFEKSLALARLSINRTAIDGKGWMQDIPWEDLQRIKNECGYSDLDAVEVFPCSGDVVNVANMRHLWVMEEPLSFVWRRT